MLPISIVLLFIWCTASCYAAEILEIETFAQYKKLLDETSPVLIKVYHPQCGWCRMRAPSFVQVSNLFEMNAIEFTPTTDGVNSPPVQMVMAAINCVSSPDLCKKLKIKAFPFLLMVNFNSSHAIDEAEVMGTAEEMYASTMNQLTVRYGQTASTQERTFERYPYAQTPMRIKNDGVEETLIMFEEVSNLQRLQDAMQSFLYILHHEVFFLKDDVLSQVDLSALQLFLHAVSTSLPLPEATITALYLQVADLKTLDKSTWEAIVTKWQARTLAYLSQESISFATLETGPLPATLFMGKGTDFKMCTVFTCGLWNLFHIMTVNVPVSDVELVYGAIRAYVENFFTCTHCQKHFLEASPSTFTSIFESMKNEHKNAQHVLQHWLWNLHNQVNARVQNAQWPSEQVLSKEQVHAVLKKDYEYHIVATSSGANCFDNGVLTSLLFTSVLLLL